MSNAPEQFLLGLGPYLHTLQKLCDPLPKVFFSDVVSSIVGWVELPLSAAIPAQRPA